MSSPVYDAVVLGAGPAGETAVSRLAAQGLKVALVERELIGGECAYRACIPSKTLLRASEVCGEATRTADVAEPSVAWSAVAAYRDMMIRHLDVSAQETGYREQGVDLHRGQARWRQQGPARGRVARSARRLAVLRDSVAQFPTFTEAYLKGFEQL